MLLFRVVSTPGVRKSLCLSVCFSAVPFSGGQHPRPLGVTSALHPLCIGQTPPHLFHATCTSAIPHRSSFLRTFSVIVSQHPPLSVSKKEEKCYHFVTSLLLERWKPLCLRPLRHLRSNPTRILTLFFDRLLDTFCHLWRIFCHHLASLAHLRPHAYFCHVSLFLPSVAF